jgi:hypothetical protein
MVTVVNHFYSDPWSVVDDNEDDCLASVIPMQMNGYCIVMFNLISGFAHSEVWFN